MNSISANLNIMIKASEKASKILIRDFGEVEKLQISVKGPSDFVSNADTKAEKIIINELMKAKKNYSILSEECGSKINSDSENVWIIDPIDGTTNFLHGVPHFAISIALKSNNTPSALLLTRQGVPVSALDYDTIIEGVQKGAYIVKKSEGNPDLVFLATGSEVSLALEVADLINDRNVRVVSVPCFELFEQQSESYKKSVIPDRRCIKISIEAGITHGWERYIGINGLSIGIDHYGLSAPYKDLAEEFGFTPEKVKKRISDHLNQLL